MTSIQRWTLTVVCAATAMLMLDIAVVNTALSRIAEDLDTGLSGLQWVVDAYTLALAATVLTAGSIADRIGRRRLFVWGLGIFTVTSLACALATDITMLNTARALQGIGAAILFAVSLALLAQAFPETKERASGLAIYGATIGASFAVGPLVGGALTSGLDWQWIFAVNIPIGLLGVWITRRWVEESKDPQPRKIDWIGQTLLTGGLFLLVLALLRGNEDGWGSTPIIAELVGAGALMAAFVYAQRKVTDPMIPPGLFRNQSFTGAQIAVFAISASFFAVFLYTTLYLQQILGLSPIEAGLVYIPGTILNFVVAGASATIGAKYSPRLMTVVGLTLVGVGMFGVTVAAVDSSWVILLPGTMIAMIGTGLINPTLSGLTLNSAPAQQSGLAAGVHDTFRQAGLAVGVAALGALIPAGAAFGEGSPESYVDGMNEALMVGGIVAIAGAIIAGILIGRKPQSDRGLLEPVAEPAAA
jgi:EmrB/QacA subfamily drug resistance transporter